jgi:hypothetical protein
VREYREADADNARWEGFEFRPGDVIIDAPSKSGTTWTQLLVALLIFDGPVFPEPISRMSMWLEHRVRSVEEAHAAFAAQTHRRFIKSHIPLDGVPMVDEVRYVCVGRDPRDAAISMLHHGDNMDRERFNTLIGLAPPPADEPPKPPLADEERIDRWIDGEYFPGWNVRSLAHHYTTFWERRHLPNVDLFHFEDYRRDLPGEVKRLAAHLDIPIDNGKAEELAAEASLERARSRAEDIAPEAHLGLWKDTARFFRRGTSGEWQTAMTAAQQDRYERLMASLVPPDLGHWIHDGRG